MKATATCSARFRDLRPIDLSGSDSDTSGMPWIHIVPEGDHPGTIEIPAGYDVPGHGVVKVDTEVEGLTVFSPQVRERLVQSFDGEILVDYEHHSHDKDKRTEAAGWGLELRHNAKRDGLELQTDWAAPAKKEITDKVYRYVSPEFSGAVKFEDGTFKFYPSALTGAGLTNRPKLKALKPVSANRDKSKPPTNQMDYKTALCRLLKIDPETATDDEINAKITTQSGELATSQNRARQITELTAEVTRLKGETIESDLERFAPVIEDKESARELLSLNRDSAVKVFEGAMAKLGTSGGKGKGEPLFQKNRATAPDGGKLLEDAADQEDAAQAKFRAIEAEAHKLVREKKLPWSQAFNEAKASFR